MIGECCLSKGRHKVAGRSGICLDLGRTLFAAIVDAGGMCSSRLRSEHCSGSTLPYRSRTRVVNPGHWVPGKGDLRTVAQTGKAGQKTAAAIRRNNTH